MSQPIPSEPTAGGDAPAAAAGGREADDGRVTLAAIIGAHGIAGEVRLKLFTDDPVNLRGYDAFIVGDRRLTLKTIRPGPNGAVARFAEITDRNMAEAMRGVALTVSRAALPALAEDEYYHADLIGLLCLSTEGESLGHVVAIENFGAGDVIEVERPGGKRFMVPMNREAVPEWNGERMVVDAAFAV